MTEPSAVARAREEGAELVLGDTRWAPAVLAEASRAVEAARDAGRLGPGILVTFSSGSTGKPKGIVRTHVSWEASMDPFTEVTGIDPTDVVGLPGPMSASLFAFGAWHAAAAGARVGPLDEATVVHCVPTQLATLLDLPRLRLVVCAGEPLSDVLRERLCAKRIHLFEYCGSAEQSLVGIRGAQGFAPAPGVEVTLAEGLLWARSPYLMREYLTTGPARWRDGRLTVGDAATGSPDAFELAGRAGSASVGGHTVVLAEVEDALRALPGVLDAVAVALDHPRLGQVVGAVVAARELGERWRPDLTGWPAPSRPRRLAVVDALPRLAGGKVDRTAAAEALA